MLKRLQIFAALLGGIALASPAHAQQATGEPIKVGVIVALTGGAAAVGRAQLNGALLAQKTINANGGINGRPLQIIQEDDSTNPDVAITKANKLIYTDKVVALLGGSTTGSTVAVGAVTHSVKMVQVAFNGFGPPVEAERRCVVHLSPPVDLVARAMLAYARDHKLIRVATLYDAAYGRLVFGFVEKYAAEYGVTLIASETHEIAATNTTTQAAKLRAARPDAFFTLGITGIPVRNLKELQVEQEIITGLGAANYVTVGAMGANVSNVTFTDLLAPEDPLPRHVEFVKLYQAEYGSLPKGIEASGWDALYVLAKGLKAVGPDAGEGKLCGAVSGKFEGVNADYDFSAPDTTGFKMKDWIFSRLTDGKFTRLKYRVE